MRLAYEKVSMTGFLRAIGALVFNSSNSPQEDKEQDAKQPASRPSECTVLAIDDDPAFVQIIRSVLRDEGYNVLATTSGPKGLDMLRYAPRDIAAVILDYNMPQFDGAETLRFLRKLRPNTRVIALTGVDLNLLPESFRAGVDKFICKPFQTSDLIDAIRSVGNDSFPARGAGPTNLRN